MLELRRFDLFLKAHGDGLLWEQFPLLANRCLCNVVNFHHVVELHEQHLAAPVAINSDSDAFLAVSEVDEFLLDVTRPVSADGVLHTAVEEVSNIVSSFNNDEGGRGFDVWSTGQTVEGFGRPDRKNGADFLDYSLGSGFT